MAYITASGGDPVGIARQLEILRGGRRSLRIIRAAQVGDGIERFEEYDRAALRDLHTQAAAEGRISSFVPASGSGTRLFQSLLSLYRERDTDLAHIRWRAERGDAVAKDALIVLEKIRDFAIWPELETRGCRPDSPQDIFEALFSERGVRYHDLPKGLIPFHRYDGEIRTAFAEHLREAAAVGTDSNRQCRAHFTVATTHQQAFEAIWRSERPVLEQALATHFQVSFSVQSPQTDTVGIDAEGNVLRTKSGAIAFRPGGHGAVLPNLDAADRDVVLLKNIDNVAREEFLDDIVEVRRLLCGLLLLLEGEVHTALRDLRSGGDPRPAIELLNTRFGIHPVRESESDETLRAYAEWQLDRPIRVCGVVGTLDHAGGRPFWVETDARGETLQIVEEAEVNLNDPQERRLFRQSRHFNPVDIACSTRRSDGTPFDLKSFVVASRALIARKVIAGTPALVYEHPGLWNGSMGLWNTVFVEVPGTVFNPVKSLADLWAPTHRLLSERDR